MLATIVASGLLLLRRMDRRGRPAWCWGPPHSRPWLWWWSAAVGLGSTAMRSPPHLPGQGTRMKSGTPPGRLEIWPLVFGKIARSPMLGYGYGCSGVTLGDLVVDDLQPLRHAHSELLNVGPLHGLVRGCAACGHAAPARAGFLAPSRRPARLYLSPRVYRRPYRTGPADAYAQCTEAIAWIVAMLWRRCQRASHPGITSPAAMRMPGDDPP